MATRLKCTSCTSVVGAGLNWSFVTVNSRYELTNSPGCRLFYIRGMGSVYAIENFQVLALDQLVKVIVR